VNADAKPSNCMPRHSHPDAPTMRENMTIR
jgi:hypothetical protein